MFEGSNILHINPRNPMPMVRASTSDERPLSEDRLGPEGDPRKVKKNWGDLKRQEEGVVFLTPCRRTAPRYIKTTVRLLGIPGVIHPTEHRAVDSGRGQVLELLRTTMPRQILGRLEATAPIGIEVAIL